MELGLAILKLGANLVGLSGTVAQGDIDVDPDSIIGGVVLKKIVKGVGITGSGHGSDGWTLVLSRGCLHASQAIGAVPRDEIDCGLERVRCSFPSQVAVGEVDAGLG